MKLLVATDAHIFETPDGRKWCSSIYDYRFWTRYLSVFDSVRIVARCKKIESPDKKLLVEGPGVEVYGLPFYQGPKQLVKVYFKTKKSLKKAYDGCDVALYRLPSQTANMAYKVKPKKMKFAGEIVYDPLCDYKVDKGIVKFLDKLICKQLSDFCKKADCISYVTKHEIQNHFPSEIKDNADRFETHYSTITLDSSVFGKPLTSIAFENGVVLGLSDVAMNSERKGERTLINVISTLINNGVKAKAIIIGDGSKRKEFEQYAKEKGVESNIDFVGLLANSYEVMDKLKECNMFFFPTNGEGLPRGILEAMAIGLPVLSSPVGGIVEILPKDCLFESTDYLGFSNRIIELIKDINTLIKMSSDNIKTAMEYKNDVLQQRRIEMYTKLKQIAEKV